MNDACKFPGGIFTITVYEDQAAFERGEVKRRVSIKNKMTNACLAVLTGLVGNTGAQTAFGWLAVGSDASAVSAADTALHAEIATSGLSRAATTNSRTTVAQTNDTLNFSKTFTASGTLTVQEVGIFNAASVGVMLARALTGAISLVNGNVINFLYTWQVVGN